MENESIASKLQEIFDLFNSGALDKEEYEQLKAEIIGDYLTDDFTTKDVKDENNEDVEEIIEKQTEEKEVNVNPIAVKQNKDTIDKKTTPITKVIDKAKSLDVKSKINKQLKKRKKIKLSRKNRENLIVLIIISVIVVVAAGIFIGISFNKEEVDKPVVTKKKDKPIVKKEITKENEPKATIKDIDGNVYETIKIGNQTWMIDNLKTVHYNDGTPIKLVTDGNTWRHLTTDAYCWYNNDSRFKSSYGALYNGYVIDKGKLCPDGWHVPNDNEWYQLSKHLEENGLGVEGDRENIARSLASKNGWHYSDVIGSVGNSSKDNNTTGFNAKPSGIRFSNGEFRHKGESAKFWSSTQSTKTGIIRFINYDNPKLVRFSNGKQNGFSVRCVKNNTTNNQKQGVSTNKRPNITQQKMGNWDVEKAKQIVIKELRNPSDWNKRNVDIRELPSVVHELDFNSDNNLCNNDDYKLIFAVTKTNYYCPPICHGVISVFEFKKNNGEWSLNRFSKGFDFFYHGGNALVFSPEHNKYGLIIKSKKLADGKSGANTRLSVHIYKNNILSKVLTHNIAGDNDVFAKAEIINNISYLNFYVEENQNNQDFYFKYNGTEYEKCSVPAVSSANNDDYYKLFLGEKNNSSPVEINNYINSHLFTTIENGVTFSLEFSSYQEQLRGIMRLRMGGCTAKYEYYILGENIRVDFIKSNCSNYGESNNLKFNQDKTISLYIKGQEFIFR